jgi:hypothetical protein
MRMQSVVAIPVIAWAFTCTGCRPEGFHPVTGKVLYQGQPAVGATVFFHKTAGPGPASEVVPTGVVGEDGSFSLSTDVVEGAPAGSYNVLILWQDRTSSPAGVPIASGSGSEKGSRKTARTASKIRPSPSLPSDRLKGRYADPEHPRLKAEVKPESNTLAPFELTD